MQLACEDRVLFVCVYLHFSLRGRRAKCERAIRLVYPYFFYKIRSLFNSTNESKGNTSGVLSCFISVTIGIQTHIHKNHFSHNDLYCHLPKYWFFLLNHPVLINDLQFCPPEVGKLCKYKFLCKRDTVFQKTTWDIYRRFNTTVRNSNLRLQTLAKCIGNMWGGFAENALILSPKRNVAKLFDKVSCNRDYEVTVTSEKQERT